MARIEIPFDAALFGQPGITCETKKGFPVLELFCFKDENIATPMRVLIKRPYEDRPYIHSYTRTGAPRLSRSIDMNLVMYREVHSNLMDVINANGFEGVPISIVFINLQTGLPIPELCETVGRQEAQEMDANPPRKTKLPIPPSIDLYTEDEIIAP